MSESHLPTRIEDFIHKMGEATTVDQIFILLLKHIQELEFERFAYWLIWPPEGAIRPLCLTNYAEEWTEHYNRKNMVSDDYVGRYSAISVTPFLWQELIAQVRLTKRQRMVFTDSADAGMRAGGTIPLHGPGAAKATFSVTNDMEDSEFSKLFKSRRHEVHLIATYAHETILKLGLHKPLQAIVSLTPREVEVLTWAAKGKSRWEASVILDVKEDTIKTHLENARTKLNASNTTNAIAIAMLNGLIYP